MKERGGGGGKLHANGSLPRATRKQEQECHGGEDTNDVRWGLNVGTLGGGQDKTWLEEPLDVIQGRLPDCLSDLHHPISDRDYV